jgi:lysine decarboxylase
MSKETIMDTPLYNALKKHIADDIYPFHMPGHKQGRGLNIADAMEIDVTEIEGLDNLHHAQGVILEAQKLTAEVFGAEETFFLVNGSSSGIMAAILTACNPGDKLLVSRNCHRSVYSGMIFTGTMPIYVEPDILQPYGLVGGINPDKIRQVMKSESIKAVIITSPTYEGFTSDVKAIAEIVHSYAAILIVDEAHGAHFKFHEAFPKTALEQGADIVIQSVHKTLPSLTQSSLLHVQGPLVERDKLRQMLAMVQTSSPSYILMSSIDLCKTQLTQDKFDAFVDKLNQFRKVVDHTIALKLLGREVEGKASIVETDISKIIIVAQTKEITGPQLDTLLLKKYKLQMEMSGLSHIVAIATSSDTTEGFERLTSALLEIDKTLDYSEPKSKFFVNTTPAVIMTPREAMFKTKIAVPLTESVGKISAELVIPYPPGIPILAPGEVITTQIIDAIYKYKQNSIPILGTKYYNQDKLQIIKD